MNAPARHFQALLSAARARSVCVVLALLVPTGAAVAFAAWRWFGPAAAVFALLAAGVVAAAWLWQRRRAVDAGWLARRLDADQPGLEDSSALLARDGELTRLQRLQQQRIGLRLLAVQPNRVRPPWPRFALALSTAASLGLVLLALAWQGPSRTVPSTASERVPGERSGPAPEATITRARIEIIPPAYTGLPTRVESGLDASAPAGSILRWELELDPQPETAILVLLDGEPLALERSGDHWVAERRLDQSTLYRVDLAPSALADAPMHRLDAISDQPPRVRVLEPDQNVVYALDGQANWALAFEASDDHGLGDAELVLTLAQGSGEIVDFSEIRRPVDGTDVPGPDGPVRRRYETSLDLAELGVGPGDDLVARLEVLDNREPEPQRGRSASVVLRWPPPSMGDVAGFDGLMQRAMPAYFRSQRQIIIDAEALIAERESIAAATFVGRSNDIGIDQQLLRLRYGQFMGEEAEGGELGHDHDHDHGPDHAAAPARGTAPGAAESGPGRASPPDAPRPVFNPLFADSGAHAHDHDHDHDHDDHHPHDDDHPDGGTHAHGEHEDEAGLAASAARFGDADDIVARYGHLHDIPEAATLLDPQTRETLRGALRAMWDAEGALRLGEPEAALPHAYEALALIQEARQANRIYLARVGLELPPIDESRRLSADLDGLSDRSDPLEPGTAGAGPLSTLWAAVQVSVPEAERRDALADAGEWILDHRDRLENPLGLIGAIDALQRDPGCRECARALRAALWPELALPAATVVPRPAATDTGSRYLQALDDGREP